MARLDHLVICATDLDRGTAETEALLGVVLEPGGQHPVMGTHNRLLSLGPDLYLEVIAIDRESRPPGRARWFDLGRFSGPSRLAAWVVACDDLKATLEAAPAGAGTPLALARDDLRWRMAVPETGVLPFGGCYPALIEWQDGGHPAPRLPDSGCRLRSLRVRHPQAGALAAGLPDLGDDRVGVETGPAALIAEIDTPDGVVTLPC